MTRPTRQFIAALVLIGVTGTGAAAQRGRLNVPENNPNRRRDSRLRPLPRPRRLRAMPRRPELHRRPLPQHGSVATLEEAVEFYSNGGVRNPSLNPRLRGPAPRFSADEKRQLVAFLRALSGRLTEGLPGVR